MKYIEYVKPENKISFALKLVQNKHNEPLDGFVISKVP